MVSESDSLNRRRRRNRRSRGRNNPPRYPPRFNGNRVPPAPRRGSQNGENVSESGPTTDSLQTADASSSVQASRRSRPSKADSFDKSASNPSNNQINENEFHTVNGKE